MPPVKVKLGHGDHGSADPLIKTFIAEAPRLRRQHATATGVMGRDIIHMALSCRRADRWIDEMQPTTKLLRDHGAPRKLTET